MDKKHFRAPLLAIAFIAAILIFGCISENDSYKLARINNPPPKELAVCGLDNLGNFDTANREQYACVVSIAIAKHDIKLCDFAPDYTVYGTQSYSKYDSSGCIKQYEGGYDWHFLLGLKQTTIMAILKTMKENNFDFNNELFNRRSDAGKTTILAAAALDDSYSDNLGTRPFGNVSLDVMEHEEILSFLIQNGANVDARGSDGKTAIHLLAAEIAKGDYSPKTDLEIFQFLTDKGADMNAKDNSGSTPLMSAVDVSIGSYKEKIVDALLKNGADVNARDLRGRTPLMHAIIADYDCEYSLGTVKTLIAAGADINAKDNDGVTPLTLAQNTTCIEIKQVLTENNAINSN